MNRRLEYKSLWKRHSSNYWKIDTGSVLFRLLRNPLMWQGRSEPEWRVEIIYKKHPFVLVNRTFPALHNAKLFVEYMMNEN